MKNSHKCSSFDWKYVPHWTRQSSMCGISTYSKNNAQNLLLWFLCLFIFSFQCPQKDAGLDTSKSLWMLHFATRWLMYSSMLGLAWEQIWPKCRSVWSIVLYCCDKVLGQELIVDAAKHHLTFGADRGNKVRWHKWLGCVGATGYIPWLSKIWCGHGRHFSIRA